MKTPRLFGMLFLGAILITSFSVTVQAQKGKPQPPQPPANPAIAYSASKQNQLDLMVMNADGSNQRAVISQKFTENLRPDWSPDGTRLVFVRNNVRDGSSGTYIVKVDASGLSRIASPSQGTPAWSPVALGDGQYKIAFTSRVNLDGTIDRDTDLFLVNLDGSSLTQLTDTDGINEDDVDWSPTGDRLVVATVEGDLPNLVVDLWIYQVDCSGSSQCSANSLGNLVNIPGSPLAGTDAGGPDWAKTQDKILLSSNTGADGSYDLWIIDLANPFEPIRVTDTYGINEWWASFSPDDSRIVFSKGQGGGLYVMNSDGTGAKLLATPTGVFWDSNWRRNP